MIEQKTIISQIEITQDAIIKVRFALLILKNGVEIASSWHRISIQPGNVEHILASVNADITERLAAEPIGVDQIQYIKSVTDLIHTTEVVNLYKERISSRDAGKGKLPAGTVSGTP